MTSRASRASCSAASSARCSPSARSGRVHIGRWGEGAAHLHWWFIARPAGLAQLASSMAEIWDEVLPPTPQDVWRENVALVAEAMRRG